MRTRTRARTLGATLLATALTGLMVLAFTQPAQAVTETVTIDGQTRNTDGLNVYRSANFLVRYTPSFGATTQTNEWGFEAAVVNGQVTKVEDLVGNMAIPANGYVLSGHGTSRTWLKAMAQVGDTVSLNGSGGGGGTPSATPTPTPSVSTPPPSGGTEKLPDVGIRTLRQFSITTTNGKKLLKFPGVTADVGAGPLDIQATRSSSTSTDWVGVQRIKMSDGSWKSLPPTGAQFYFAGDGHNHWHIRDFDSYELFNGGGQKLRDGEKHGFCFEDNTEYRDWPSTGKNGASATPVYTHENACGLNNPQATKIVHGLSQGWSDTYPATLPDQAIDITGIADGVYTVKVTADWQGFYKESNENNNSATAKIQIKGNTVTLMSATDGL
jgi:hypothetical protein